MIAGLAVERYNRGPVSQTGGCSMVMRNRRFGSPNRGYSRADSKSATRLVLEEELADNDRPGPEPAEIAALLRGRGAPPEQRRVPLEELAVAEPAADDTRQIAVDRARRSIRAEVREMTREIRPRQRRTEVYRAPPRPTLWQRLRARLRAWLQ